MQFLDKKDDCQNDDKICSLVKPEKSLQEFLSEIKRDISQRTGEV